MNKAKTFAKAVVKHAANGFKEATDETIQFRQYTCAICTHLKGESCGLCGCKVFGNGKFVKTRWQTEECPKGFWGKELSDEISDGD